MFITTANTLQTLAPPLHDRMEILELDGYTEEEKVRIAQEYPARPPDPGKLAAAGRDLVDDAAIRAIIRTITREAGVRAWNG